MSDWDKLRAMKLPAGFDDVEDATYTAPVCATSEPGEALVLCACGKLRPHDKPHGFGRDPKTLN